MAVNTVTGNMCRDILAEAQEAASAAFKSCRPTPMVVGQARGLFGNEIVPGTEEVVEDGVCGFAWVKIRPARGPFVKFLKARDIGRKDDYEGGYYLSSYDVLPFRDFTQSMERKYAACSAFAGVLSSYGLDAYAMSRMD
jgi:hypothetical protein